MIPAVTVTVAGQQLDPVAYHWQVPVAGNHLKRTYAETLSSTPAALESDFWRRHHDAAGDPGGLQHRSDR